MTEAPLLSATFTVKSAALAAAVPLKVAVAPDGLRLTPDGNVPVEDHE